MPDYASLILLDRTRVAGAYMNSLLNKLESYVDRREEYIVTGFVSSLFPIKETVPTVGYEYVEERNIDGNNDSMGKSTFEYKVTPIKGFLAAEGLPRQEDISNGSLWLESYYDSKEKLLKSVYYSYSDQQYTIPRPSDIDIITFLYHQLKLEL